jgi:hypothetical protein
LKCIYFSVARLDKQLLISLLSLALSFATWPQGLWASQDSQATVQDGQAPRYAPQTPEQLQQLVAPIALYPDSLVAQILAASTFPEQVVEADRWVQAHPDLKGDAFSQAVNQQPWDPSVKALQPATGCAGCRTGDAPAGATSRHSSDHATANRNHARLDDHR